MKKFSNKKVLITGASGFLGTYLADLCSQEDAILYGIDIREPFKKEIWSGFSTAGLLDNETELLFKNNSFDYIFHLAGGASIQLSVENPSEDFNNLVPPTLAFLQWIKQYCSAAHFVLFSSAAVYGNPDSLPIKETAVLKPISPYGIHKLLAENLVQHYSNYYNIRSSVLRIFSAYGEGLRKQLFWDVLNRYKTSLDKLQNNEVVELSLFGTGKESRDFIHAKDVAQAAVLIATCDASEETQFNVYNVANGKETSIGEAANCLFKEAVSLPDIKFGGVARTGDPEKWRADISKLQRIGFKETVSIDSGLNSLYEWFMNLSNL